LEASSVEIALGSPDANLTKKQKKARALLEQGLLAAQLLATRKLNELFSGADPPQALLDPQQVDPQHECEANEISTPPRHDAVHNAPCPLATEEVATPKPPTAKLLLHKRRLTQAMIEGTQAAHVCRMCYSCIWREKPHMPPVALANDFWIGRSVPLLAEANFWHKQLLAQYRFVVSVVWLRTSAGDSGDARVASWQKNFLQTGMRGTGIMFDNAGNVADEVRTLPDERLSSELQVAILGGSKEDYNRALIGAINPNKYVAQFDYLKRHSDVFEDVSQDNVAIANLHASFALKEAPAILKACIKLVPDDADEEGDAAGPEDEGTTALGPATLPEEEPCNGCIATV